MDGWVWTGAGAQAAIRWGRSPPRGCHIWVKTHSVTRSSSHGKSSRRVLKDRRPWQRVWLEPTVCGGVKSERWAWVGTCLGHNLEKFGGYFKDNGWPLLGGGVGKPWNRKGMKPFAFVSISLAAARGGMGGRKPRQGLWEAGSEFHAAARRWGVDGVRDLWKQSHRRFGILHEVVPISVHFCLLSLHILLFCLSKLFSVSSTWSLPFSNNKGLV